MYRSLIALALAALTLSAGAASATPYTLNYEDLSGNLYSAELTADLALDANTLENIVGLSFMINGTPFAADVTASFTDIAEGSGVADGTPPPVLTLDGSYLDFFIGGGAPTQGFIFAVDGIVEGGFNSSIGTGFEVFDVAAYQLTEGVSAVPLPAALPLGLAGFAALAAIGRRRRTA